MRKGRKGGTGLEHPVYVIKQLFSSVVECDSSLGFKTSFISCIFMSMLLSLP